LAVNEILFYFITVLTSQSDEFRALSARPAANVRSVDFLDKERRRQAVWGLALRQGQLAQFVCGNVCSNV
jgi:hypothetical protein